MHPPKALRKNNVFTHVHSNLLPAGYHLSCKTFKKCDRRESGATACWCSLSTGVRGGCYRVFTASAKNIFQFATKVPIGLKHSNVNLPQHRSAMAKLKTHRIHVCYIYMVTFTINIPPMLVYIYIYYTIHGSYGKCLTNMAENLVSQHAGSIQTPHQCCGAPKRKPRGCWSYTKTNWYNNQFGWLNSSAFRVAGVGRALVN